MAACNHKFIDSKRCLKCGMHIDALRVESAAELERLRAEPPIAMVVEHGAAPALGPGAGQASPEHRRARFKGLRDAIVNGTLDDERRPGCICLDPVDRETALDALRLLLILPALGDASERLLAEHHAAARAMSSDAELRAAARAAVDAGRVALGRLERALAAPPTASIEPERH